MFRKPQDLRETSYQRLAREQAERQAARKRRFKAQQRARKWSAREGRRERAYADALISDHNHDMDG